MSLFDRECAKHSGNCSNRHRMTSLSICPILYALALNKIAATYMRRHHLIYDDGGDDGDGGGGDGGGGDDGDVNRDSSYLRLLSYFLFLQSKIQNVYKTVRIIDWINILYK